MRRARRRRRAERALEAAVRGVAEQTGIQAEAARKQAIAAHELPALREGEATAAAALVRLKRGLDEIEAANRRAKQRATELGQRLTELQTDLARQDNVARDATESLARLADEDQSLEREGRRRLRQRRNGNRRTDRGGSGACGGRVGAYAAAQAALSELTARRGALERALREARDA
jgi:chromosome segregation protein